MTLAGALFVNYNSKISASIGKRCVCLLKWPFFNSASSKVTKKWLKMCDFKKLSRKLRNSSSLPAKFLNKCLVKSWITGKRVHLGFLPYAMQSPEQTSKHATIQKEHFTHYICIFRTFIFHFYLFSKTFAVLQLTIYLLWGWFKSLYFDS